MRSRKAIEDSYAKGHFNLTTRKQETILEVILDIRDLLKKLVEK